MSNESSPSRPSRRRFKRQESDPCQNDECVTKRLSRLSNYYSPQIDQGSSELIFFANNQEMKFLAWYAEYMCRDIPPADSEKVIGLAVDFLICEGYREAAELLCSESKMEFPEKEKAGLHKRYEIRTSIVNGDISRAVEQIQEYVPELLDSHPRVHFQLLRQQLVELIREK